MINEDVLQKTLAATIERLGRQVVSYETEIANLNAQIIIMSDQVKTVLDNGSNKENSEQ